MRITHCKSGHLTNPLGYSLEKPVLTWIVENSCGTCAQSTRIVASYAPDLASPFLDTGFSTDISSLGYVLNGPFPPRTRVYWQVTVCSDACEKAVSCINWFETGKEDEVWCARWIGRAGNRPPVYSRTLPVRSEGGAPVKNARLYICGLGLYEAYLNGRRIGCEYLTPGCTNYNRWVQADTFDITEDLAAGGRLCILLGDGWYKGRFGFHSNPGDPGWYGDSWKLIAEIRITYSDGTERIVGTDEDWTVSDSPFLFSGIYDGEVFDPSEAGAHPARAALCEPPKGALTDRYSPEVRIIEERPVTLLHTPAGETVLDTGQNIAGLFSFHVCLPAGQKLHLKFGEELQDGNFYRDNLRTALAEYTFLSDGKEHTLIPRFTFYGYRYVLVEGCGEADPEDFKALPLTSDCEEILEIATGHAGVNRLLSNISWGRRDNFIDVPTDCPQRDERMGWTGDTQVFASTALFQTDAFAFYRKFLHDCATEQEDANGMVPNVVPSFDVDGCSSVWGDATTILPMEIWRATGDRTILEEHYPCMLSWVDYITCLDGEDKAWRRSFHFGDWLALDRPGAADATRGATDEGFIADVYYMNSALLASEAADLLGRTADRDRYLSLADRLKSRILEDFYGEDGLCRIRTQTAMVLSLRYQLGDEERCAGALRSLLEENGGHLNTGFVGTPLLCDVLSDHGMGDLAVRLLLNEDFPGWLHEVNLGATTVWERWNSLDKDGHFSSTGMNSLNHYAYGSVEGWICRHLAGLQAITPGYKKALICPAPARALRSLDFSCRTAAGTYRISWAYPDEEHLTFRITVPFDAAAVILFPEGFQPVHAAGDPNMPGDIINGSELSAGTYTFTCRQT